MIITKRSIGLSILQISGYSSNDKLNFVFRPHDKESEHLKNIFDLIGQEIIDRKNASLYQAIAQNDFNSLQQAVEQGCFDQCK